MSLGVAFKAFFAALSSREKSDRLKLALEPLSGRGEPIPEAKPPRDTSKPQADRPVTSGRSDALTLLSTLQRESRFLDLVHESLDGFDDAQIGCAAREVIRDCRKTLDRIFAINHLAEQDEGSSCPISSNPSPAQFRIVGASGGSLGTITHRGWKATRCEVPIWNGERGDSWILAPVEIEVNAK
jgi:hypothetical protein